MLALDEDLVDVIVDLLEGLDVLDVVLLLVAVDTGVLLTVDVDMPVSLYLYLCSTRLKSLAACCCSWLSTPTW